MPRCPQVSSRHVLVTGCSSGIGAAAAEVLRAEGWIVHPTARKEEDLEQLRAGGFDPIALDMADSVSVQAAATLFLERCDGPPGGLVNNAGFGQPGAVEDLTREAMRYQFEVNLFGLQELTNALLPAFRAAGAGRIVNISSVVGRISLPFMGIYSSSKFALEALSDALRVELHGTGIRVSLVEPGPIKTRFGVNAVEQASEKLDREASRFGAVYAREVDSRQAGKRREDRFRLPPEAVAVKIRHALESPWPRRRYPVTFPAWAGGLARRFLPYSLTDALLQRGIRSHTENPDE